MTIDTEKKNEQGEAIRDQLPSERKIEWKKSVDLGCGYNGCTPRSGDQWSKVVIIGRWATLLQFNDREIDRHKTG